MKRFIGLSLALALLLTGCALPGGKEVNNLMAGVTTQPLRETVEIGGENAVGPTDFAVRLFQESLNGEETAMISPVSVLYALAMTANGAKEETLAEMETVLGMDVETLNDYCKAYLDALPEGKDYQLHMANSIWLTDKHSFTVSQDFLQRNADYYGADLYQLPLNSAACQEINNWVNTHTKGMIPSILDDLSPYAVMVLVNAMAFDAKWRRVYQGYQVREGFFIAADGKAQTAQMMHSNEQYYLEDDDAIGFLKHYQGSEYAFAALLPKGGGRLEDYITSLSGEKLSALLSNPQEITVFATMPKFETEYAVDLSQVLSSMGMETAFDFETADFSGLGSSENGNIFISRVIHKTFITVGEEGTKAAASTAVESPAASSPLIEEYKEVVLDRPFLYMIIDCEANLPLFMGTLTKVA